MIEGANRLWFEIGEDDGTTFVTFGRISTFDNEGRQDDDLEESDDTSELLAEITEGLELHMVMEGTYEWELEPISSISYLREELREMGLAERSLSDLNRAGEASGVPQVTSQPASQPASQAIPEISYDPIGDIEL